MKIRAYLIQAAGHHLQAPRASLAQADMML